MRTLSWKKIAQRSALALTFAGGLAACGSSSDDKKAEDGATPGVPGDVGTGSVTKLVDGKATISFPNATAGQQYALLTYALGDIATVPGGLDSTKFEFTIKSSTSGASFRMLDPGAARFALDAQGDDPRVRARQLDRDLRHLLNRYSPRDGLDQGAGVWELAESIDRRANLGLTDRLVRSAMNPRAVRASLALAPDESCPTNKLTVPGPGGDPEEITLPGDTVVESGVGYCLVIVGKLVTEPDKAALKKTIESQLKTFKDVIYKDSFASTDKFVFRPVFVFVDFANTTVWPSGLPLAGAFSREVSEDFGKPLLFMPTNLKAAKGFESVTDTALLRRTLHGTMGHELHHAISAYIRTVKNKGALDTRTVDEGLAQFTEDFNGFGEDNFAGMSKAFIDVFGAGSVRFLQGESAEIADDNTTRGTTYALLYYLASQKGGVDFTGGLPSGGGGLDLFKTLVTNAQKTGPANLAASFGGSWVDVVGDYLGSLVLDNMGIATVESKYVVKEPVTTVTNLIGEKNKTFGMRFNKYKEIPDRFGDYIKYANNEVKLTDVSHYHTKPVLYEVTVPGETLSVSVTDAGVLNSAISVVRIK